MCIVFFPPILRFLISTEEFFLLQYLSPSTSVTNSTSLNFTPSLYKINVFQAKILHLLVWLYPHDDNVCFMPLC